MAPASSPLEGNGFGELSLGPQNHWESWLPWSIMWGDMADGGLRRCVYETESEAQTGSQRLADRGKELCASFHTANSFLPSSLALQRNMGSTGRIWLSHALFGLHAFLQ